MSKTIWACRVEYEKAYVGSATVTRETAKLYVVKRDDGDYNAGRAFGFRNQLHKDDQTIHETRDAAIQQGIDECDQKIAAAELVIKELQSTREKLLQSKGAADGDGK